MKNFLKSELFFKIASVVIAAILWLYVVQFENPEFQISVSDIPVRIENELTLSQNNLILTSQNKTTVSFRVKGRRQTVSALDKNSIYAYIDMKSVTSAGEYNLPVKVIFSENNLSVADNNAPKVHVTIENKVSTEYPVKLVTTGTVQDGYYSVPENPDLTVRVLAPESTAHLVASVRAELDITSAYATVEKNVPLRIYDENSNIITSKNIKCDTENADVRCNIYPTKELPIKWNETGVPPENSKGLRSTAKTVKIAAPGDVLAGLESIDLGEIDRSTFSPTNNIKTFSVKDILGSENVYVADKNFTIMLTMDFEEAENGDDEKDLKEAKITVSDIEVTGVPENYTAEVLTAGLSVPVTGKASVVESVYPEDIEVTVDLSELSEEQLSEPYIELSPKILTSKNITVGETEPVKVKLMSAE